MKKYTQIIPQSTNYVKFVRKKKKLMKLYW